MTLVEKMARAISRSIYGSEEYWENWDDSARMVLAAMRYPDEEEGGRIETAGMFALPFDQIHDGEPYKQANSALLCWQAMIDQAIKEGEQ